MTDRRAEDEIGERADVPSNGAAPAELLDDAGQTTTSPTANLSWRERRKQRVSKWDRPPDPHDWRFFVGMLGKVLIATGVLLFGFVAYQLWGTGIETARAQSALEDEFATLIAESQTVATQPSVVTTVPATTPVTSPPTTIATDGTAPATTTTTTTPTTTAPPTTAVEQVLPPVERGQALARLEIPRIGKTGNDAMYVVPGVTRNDLKKGPGHYPDTPLPGQLGNAAIAGHRTTYGEPFRHVDDLVPGDEMIVTMANGETFVYDVTGTEVVGAGDSWVIATTDPTVANLTLTSCHPVGTARDRIIVYSVLNPERSAAVGVPTYYELDETEDEAIDFDDPSVATETTDEGSDDPDTETTSDTVSDDGTVDEATDDSSVDESDESVDDDTSDTSDGDVAGAVGDGGADPGAGDPAVDPTATADAFQEGWFDDDGAWPQIALWGALLTLISIGAYFISRRFRHDSVGFLVGIFPFLFCLYFFFQNVNRLLPPGL